LPVTASKELELPNNISDSQQQANKQESKQASDRLLDWNGNELLLALHSAVQMANEPQFC